MTVWINRSTRWQGSGPDYQKIHDLCHDIDQEFKILGIDGCVCFDDRELIHPEVIEYIERTNYEIYFVLVTEFNSIDRRTRSGQIQPHYAQIRLKLNELALVKKIILASAQSNDHLDGPPTPNLHRIHVPCVTMLQDHRQFSTIPYLHVKDFSSPYHWVSLNRNPHHHRIMMAMIMLGLDLAIDQDNNSKTGLLHIGVGPIERASSWQEYWGSDIKSIDDQQQKILLKGFQRLKQIFHVGQPDARYLEIDLGNKNNYNMVNYRNFDQCLRHIYQGSVIEIINGTTFYNPAGTTHCEKYTNSILGLNLPLFLGNLNTVKEVRDMGFDVFDDVLDHGYDSITDPMQRMFALVESNLELLRNGDLAREVWVKCLPRLLNNVEHYYRLYDSIRTITTDRLKHQLIEGMIP